MPFNISFSAKSDQSLMFYIKNSLHVFLISPECSLKQAEYYFDVLFQTPTELYSQFVRITMLILMTMKVPVPGQRLQDPIWVDYKTKGLFCQGLVLKPIIRELLSISRICAVGCSMCCIYIGLVVYSF